MSIDLTPAAAAAPRGRRIVRHAAIEARLTARNGEQLLLALVIPAALLVGGGFAAPAGMQLPAQWPALVLALAAWSTGFTSAAITTGYERRYGVLERLAATPLSRADLLVGKATAVGILALGQAVVLTALALVAGWRPAPGLAQSLVALAAVVLALLAFAALALALAGAASAELTLALANLLYLALGAALMLPSSILPGWAATALALLPTTALGHTLVVWANGGFDPFPLLVLAVWAGAAFLLARKVFRWTS